MIRKATREDIAMIYQAHVSSIIELCTGIYTPAQIIAWIQAIVPDNYVRGMENFEFYVGEDTRGHVSGLLIFNKKTGEVYALYIAPWAANNGLGRSLIDLAENVIQNCGRRRISLKSTLNAVSFYEHMGFKCVGESVHELKGGEPLPCVQMIKQLS